MTASLSRQLLDSLPDSVLVVDVDGSVIAANRSARQLFGDDVIGVHAGLPVEDFREGLSPWTAPPDLAATSRWAGHLGN